MRNEKAKSGLLAIERARIHRKAFGRRERGGALIVCEGEFTEPYYLKGLLAYLNINSASVEIIAGQTRSNAVAVVKRARDRFQQIPRDRVFVVIDGEQADLSRALQLCKTPVQRVNPRLGQTEIKIEPIISFPCFEVWLLLHFRYCDQPFAAFSDVLPILKSYLTDYAKRDPHIFYKVGAGEGLERAISHARYLRASRQQTGGRSPATDMDVLVESLRGISLSV